MIGNFPENKGLASIEILEELAKGEAGRFKKALAKASNKYFEEKSKGMTPKEARDLWMKGIVRAQSVITFAFDDAYDTAFTLLKDPDHARKGWDDHLTGVRSISRPAPRGFLLSVIMKQLKLEETADHVSALVIRGNEVQNDVHRVVAKAKAYIDHYEWAKKHAEGFGHEENEDAIRKYASLKTWERKDEFTQFSSVAKTATAGAIEVIIEGPVKLYLMISPEQLLIVLQGLAMRNSFDFMNADKKGLEDSLDLLLLSQKAVEKSDLFTTLRGLLASTLHEYHALWDEEHLDIRKEMIDEEREKRFVECFENGSLFVKK
jgi:hypothetical protein